MNEQWVGALIVTFTSTSYSVIYQVRCLKVIIQDMHEAHVSFNCVQFNVFFELHYSNIFGIGPLCGGSR